MRLLSPENIKIEKEDRIRETAKINEVVANASINLNKELNLVRDKAEEEKKAVALETETFVAQQNALAKEALTLVEQLEKKRKAALEPIIERERAVDAREMAITTAEGQIKAKELTLQAQQESINEDLEILADRKGDIFLSEQKLATREAKVKTEEKRLAESTNNLSNKWVEFHKTVTESNKDFNLKITDLQIREQTVKNSIEAINKRTKEQDEKDRALTDKYFSLIKAVEEHKKNGIKFDL